MSRAEADLAAGRAWKARDRLTGLLTHRQDEAVLDLLATVHHQMHDLPAAGALWFVTGRDDEPAHAAIDAWRQRHGNDHDRWYSILAPIRRRAKSADLKSLQASAARDVEGRARVQRGKPYQEAWWEPIVFGGGAIVFVLWVVSMIGIGMWTVLRWIWT
jgi:hypothetical protein